jgi:hypothetical protein
MGVSGQRHAQGAPGGWVGPRAGLDAKARGKIPSPLPGFEPRSPGRPIRTVGGGNLICRGPPPQLDLGLTNYHEVPHYVTLACCYSVSLGSTYSVKNPVPKHAQ